eukprot:jgi/Tetstr1/455854/TSEL_042644.t1
MREARGRFHPATAGHLNDADARVMERKAEAASGSQTELTSCIDQANDSRLHNESATSSQVELAGHRIVPHFSSASLLRISGLAAQTKARVGGIAYTFTYNACNELNSGALFNMERAIANRFTHMFAQISALANVGRQLRVFTEFCACQKAGARANSYDGPRGALKHLWLSPCQSRSASSDKRSVAPWRIGVEILAAPQD